MGSQIEAFAKNSSEDEQALYEWGLQIAQAVSATNRSICEPVADGSARLDHPVPDLDVGQEQEPQPSTTTLKQVEADQVDDITDNPLLPEIEETEAETPLFSGSTAPESGKRKVRVSAKFLVAAASLGVNQAMFERTQ